MIVDVNDPRFFPMRKEICKHWQWSWEENKTDGGEDKDGGSEEVEPSDEGGIVVTGNVTVPESPGYWSPRSTEWLDTQYLYFSKKKNPSDEISEENEGEVVEDNAENKNEMVLPYMRVWVVLSADHVANTVKASSVIVRKWNKDFKAGEIALQLHTPTIKTGYFDLPTLTEEGAIYEVVSTSVLGCHVNISCKCQVEMHTFQSLNNEILKKTVKTISGKSENVIHPNSWRLLKRCTFSAVTSSPDTGNDEGETEKNAGPLNMCCHVWSKNPFLKRYLTIYTMNNDTREIIRCPLLKFNNSQFVANNAGYSVYLVCQNGAEPLPSFEWELSLITKNELIGFAEIPICSIQDFSSQYIPNKYYRLLRDVIDVIPGEDEITNSTVGSMRLTMSDSSAYASLRVINPITKETIIEKSGKGFVDLLDVPLTTPVSEDAEVDTPYNGKVIVESVLMPNLFYIDDSLRSRRPYHYPSGQPGDEQPSDFTWNLRVICGGNGIALNRDLTQEKTDQSIRDSWEEAQEGRAVLAKATRSYFLYLQQQQQKSNILSGDSNSKDEEIKTDEIGNAEESVNINGLDGLDEEQQVVEKSRRDRLAQAVNERPQLSTPVVIELKKTAKPIVLQDEIINGMREKWSEASAKSSEMLQTMMKNIDNRTAIFDKYKIERLEDFKTNMIDKYATEIGSIYNSYAVSNEEGGEES
eukprot:g751.t1